MKEISIIGVDLAKNVFQVHGAAADGSVVFRKKLSRLQFGRFMADHPACEVAMEACPSYGPWHDKGSGNTFLRAQSGKCLHYYFYFIDEEFGLCYLRVPTWAPFGLQFYCNGHSALALSLEREGIEVEVSRPPAARVKTLS